MPNQAVVEALPPCFSKVWEPDLWRKRNQSEGCGIDRETIGSSLISMVPDKRHANEPCPPHPIFHQPKAGLQDAPVIHQDERGFSVTNRRCWMQSTSTRPLTHVHVDEAEGTRRWMPLAS